MLLQKAPRKTAPRGLVRARADVGLRNFWYPGAGWADVAASGTVGQPVNVTHGGDKWTFNGTSSEIQLGTVEGRLNRNFSVVAIVRPTSFSTERTIVSAGASGWNVRISTTGYLQLLESNVAVIVAGTAFVQMAVNNEYIVCATFSDGATSTVKTYVNGIETGSTTTTRTLSDSAQRLAIGADIIAGTLYNSFAGDIKAVGVFTRELRPAEVPRTPADVWGYLQPRRKPRPTTAAASTVPTLFDSTFVPGSLTSTGWRPRVTATF